MENRKREKGAPFIEIKDLSYAYPGEEGRGQQVLSHISLTIREGEYTVILGHNGSGKSTLAKLINLVIDDYTYAEGQILVGGRDVMADDLTEEDLLELRRQVGMVFQNPDNQLVATIVEEDVAFGPENLGIPNPELRERVDAALATVGMSEYAHHEPHRLSGGQKQRVAIAGIIAMKPRCMIFDESTAMLDPLGRREVLATMEKLNREEGITVLSILRRRAGKGDASQPRGRVFSAGRRKAPGVVHAREHGKGRRGRAGVEPGSDAAGMAGGILLPPVPQAHCSLSGGRIKREKPPPCRRRELFVCRGSHAPHGFLFALRTKRPPARAWRRW